MRVETLTDDEVAVIDAVRSLSNNRGQQHFAAGQREIQQDLQDIYHMLDGVRADRWEETVQEARDRIYRLLW